MINKRAALAFAAVCLALAAPAFAQDAIQGMLADKGFTVDSRSDGAQGPVYACTAPNGVKFTVDVRGEAKQEAVAQALKLFDVLAPWTSITAGTQNLRLDGDTAYLRLVPGSFAAAGRDLKPYVPSGLSFSASGDRLEYDFRVKSGAYFLRFEGPLRGEVAFLERLGQAIDDPALFAKRNDPDYMSRRVNELQTTLDDEQTARAAAEARIAALEKARTDDAAALTKAQADADKRQADADKRLALLQRAAMAVYSKGLFGDPKPIPDAAVEKVKALKAAKPTLSVAEALAGLKADFPQVNDKQVKAIFAVVFGE